MSIGNIILQRPAGYLMTDSGWWNKDGTLAHLMPKVVVSDRHRFALTAQGQHDMVAGLWQEVEHLANSMGASFSAGAVAAQFGELFAMACAIQGVGRRGWHNSERAQLVWYNEQQQRACALLVSNGLCPGETLQRYAPVSVVTSLSLSANPDAPFGDLIDITDPVQFDPRADGARLAMLQRGMRQAGPHIRAGSYVGGTVHLTTVDAEGARTEPLVAWPDQVGKRIEIEA